MKQTVAMIIGILLVLQLASAITLTDVTSSPGSVEPGKKITVSITIKNDLDVQIDNVALALNLLGIPIAPEKSSVVFADRIKSDDEKIFDFDLIANGDADTQIYSVPVTITYQLEDTDETITRAAGLISIRVNAKPILDLNADSYLIGNQNSKLTIKITNSGLANAKFLEVNVENGNYKLLSPARVYIGDINSNDFDSFTLDLFPSRQGTITIPITIRYKDPSNSDYTETQNVEVRVYSQQEALSLGLIQKSNTGLYATLIVVLIILYLIYRRVKKWAKNKKANRMNGGK